VSLDLARMREAVAAARPVRIRGRVFQLAGLVAEAVLPGARYGEMVRIESEGREPLLAEVVGLREEGAVLLPLGDPAGLGVGADVVPTGRRLSIRVGEGLVGRILDGLGRPLDGGPLPDDLEEWAVDRPSPHPLSRRRVTEPLPVGVRALDGLLTLGEGQRVGLFAGPGVGKSSLLGQIARGTRADLSVVCLVGERGREVRDFLEESLGPRGLARSVVVVATSDAPPLVRIKAASVATAVAEWFAERGGRVLLLLDSLTRLARAQREAGLAAGELPARHGYPPSVFQLLPRLLERTGNRQRGGITALYTVLVAGGDLDEPIADEVRGILDGHVVLDRRLAERGHFPAIDVLGSLSRVMPAVTDPGHRAAAARMRELLAAHERQRDLIGLGAYRRGSDPVADAALDRMGAIETFLRQGPGEEPEPFARTVERLAGVVS
jgi:type III secretion protein N (ATPase)